MRVLYINLLLSVSLLLATWSSPCECTSFEQAVCPTWMHPNLSSSQHECVCGADLEEIISCNRETSTTHIKEHYCIFFDEKLNSTLTGSCPYSTARMLPKNVSELNNVLCGLLHRKGQLCGECEDNYTLPVYSYNLGCVKCEDFKHGWINFLAAAFLPLTIFYLLVVMFRISATSSALNGYILVSQILATPAMIRFIYSDNHRSLHPSVTYGTQFAVDLGIAIYAIGNLDFFRSFYKPICLHPDLTYPQVLLLDYAVAVYPLLLIFVTFILVKMHDNFAFVTWLWRPFHKCLVLFRKQWNIRSSLVNALATFIILSYIKILNVSSELLMSSHVYNMNGQIVNVAYLYYHGTIDMTSKAYVPYLVLAVLMLLIFNIIPLLLLTLYPFTCFQKVLSCWPNLKSRIALQIFMDAFQGCYVDTSHDYRHFAALYLALRFFNLLLYSIFNYRLYLPAASLLMVFTVVLVASFKPYKCKRSNTVDIVMLLALVSGYMSILMLSDISPIFPQWSSGVMAGISALIPPSYIVFLCIAQILPKASRCLFRIKVFVLEWVNEFRTKMESKVEEQALFSHKGANYHT